MSRILFVLPKLIPTARPNMWSKGDQMERNMGYKKKRPWTPFPGQKCHKDPALRSLRESGQDPESRLSLTS